jgi:hypothetical protein
LGFAIGDGGGWYGRMLGVKRWVFNILAVLSLVLCTAAGLMWGDFVHVWRHYVCTIGEYEWWVDCCSRRAVWLYPSDVPRPVPQSLYPDCVFGGPGHPSQTNKTMIVVRYWQIMFVTAVLPVTCAAWHVRRYRNGRLRKHRLLAGLCLNCGYDLRVSEGRCPECGVEIAAKAG